jgi:hypothetical protein
MSKKTIAAIVALAIVMPAAVVIAAEEAGSTPQQSSVQASSPQVVGEWEFKSQMPARASMATMTIKKSAEGKYEGTWSAQRGESVLSDITFENGKVKFVQTSSFGGQEMKTTYEGAVEGGKITGKGQGQRGEFTFNGTLQGEAKKGAEAIVGEWQMNVMMPVREIVEKLTITKNADGTLAGKWEAQRGENTISDVKFEADKLTFTRTSKFGKREITMTFAGTVEGDNIKGVFSSERGEREANATRVTAAKAEEVKKPAEVKKAEPNTPAPEKKKP